ncbi:MAG: extracellular solute-binding protein [Anaerolineae bacterium]|nr:extracellular solute-binding protein [Anaerolineae bacterium]
MLKPNRRLPVILSTAALILVLTLSPATATPARQYEGVTLNALIVSDSPVEDCIRLVADDFAYETGALVRITSKDATALHQEAMTAFVGGTGGYDIISLADTWLGAFADPGYLASLNGYLGDEDPEDIDDILPRAMRLYGQWNGQQFALPITGEAMLLFYREDIFAQMGFSPPETWSDFENIAAQIDAAGGIRGAALNHGSQVLPLWANRYWGLGGSPLDLGQPGPVRLNPAAATEALDRLRSAQRFSPPNTRNPEAIEAALSFLSGEAAMVEMWPDLIAALSFDSEIENSGILDHIAVAQVPGGMPYSRGWGLGVSAESLNPDIAYDFIHYVTTPYYDLECFMDSGKNPIRISTYQELSESEIEGFWAEPLFEAMDNANTGSRAPQADAINTMFNDIINGFLEGRASVEEAVNQIQTKLDSFAK